jgi:hypothetical protein
MHSRRGLVALATAAAVLIPTTATQLARACTPPCSESPAGHGGGTGSPSSSSTPAPTGSHPRQRGYERPVPTRRPAPSPTPRTAAATAPSAAHVKPVAHALSESPVWRHPTQVAVMGCHARASSVL